MGVNKVVYDGRTLVDLTNNTVVASKLFKGETAKNAAGDNITGTFTIEEELSTQNALLDQLEAALANKAAGGGSGVGSVDTCTLTVLDNLGYGSVWVAATVLDSSGGVSYYLEEGLSSGTTTINNVVCGSPVLTNDHSAMGSFSSDSGATFITSTSGYRLYEITATAGGTASIVINSSGGGGYA